MFGGIFNKASRKQIDGYEVAQDESDLEGFRGHRQEAWTKEGMLHHEDGPAVLVRDRKTGDILLEQYWNQGELHRDDAPAVIQYCPVARGIKLEQYWVHGRPHRLNGPAQIEYDADFRTQSW